MMTINDYKQEIVVVRWVPGKSWDKCIKEYAESNNSIVSHISGIVSVGKGESTHKAIFTCVIFDDTAHIITIDIKCNCLKSKSTYTILDTKEVTCKRCLK